MSSIFSESSLAIWAGLAGFVSGLVMKKIGYFRRFQAILIAVGINLVFGFFFSIFKYQSFDSSDATRWIFWTSTFLISIMLILAPRVGPRQFSEGQQVPQTHQGLGAAGNILWFFQIWWIALTKPKETNYSELVENQKPSWLKAYWWAFATGFFGGVLGFLVTGDFYLDSNNLIITFLIGLVLGILSIAGFIVDSFIAHVISQLESGHGNYTKLAYVLSAINAPIIGANSFLVAYVIVKGSSDPSYWLPRLAFLICVGLIYTTVLGILAIKAINKFTIARSAIAGIPYRLFLIVAIIVAANYLRQL